MLRLSARRQQMAAEVNGSADVGGDRDRVAQFNYRKRVGDDLADILRSAGVFEAVPLPRWREDDPSPDGPSYDDGRMRALINDLVRYVTS